MNSHQYAGVCQTGQETKISMVVEGSARKFARLHHLHFDRRRRMKHGQSETTTSMYHVSTEHREVAFREWGPFASAWALKCRTKPERRNWGISDKFTGSGRRERDENGGFANPGTGRGRAAAEED